MRKYFVVVQFHGCDRAFGPFDNSADAGRWAVEFALLFEGLNLQFDCFEFEPGLSVEMENPVAALAKADQFVEEARHAEDSI